MGKTVWIMNHYASHMLFDKGGRHYSFAKYLDRAGYHPVVFCANIQNAKTDQKYIDTDDLWAEKEAEEIHTPFVYVKARTYKGNGMQRVLNMVDFYRNVKKAAKEYAGAHGKPDIILASSVHPLTLVAGLQLAKFFHVKCICEVRDLWPESLVAYGYLKRNSIPADILYFFEKRIYIKADKIIMSWPGGYDYIRARGWDSAIPADKVVHISNGTDLEEYRGNIQAHPYTDDLLNDETTKKVIYTGTIGKVNNLGIIVEAAKLLQAKGVGGFKILIYGDGNEREALMQAVKDAGLTNIVFAGKVPKQCVPSLLTHAYVTLLHNSSTALDKYGQSQNKFFEYLAAGKPVFMTYSVGHSICKNNHCGLELDVQSLESIANTVEFIADLCDNEYQEYCSNAQKTAEDYDFAVLTQKLIRVIEELLP